MVTTARARQAPTPSSVFMPVDRDQLVQQVAGAILPQLKDLFARVTVTANVPPITLIPPNIPTPQFHFSPTVAAPSVTINPQIDARPDMSELAGVMRELTTAIRDLLALESRPTRRHVVRNSAGEITDTIEERT